MLSDWRKEPFFNFRFCSCPLLVGLYVWIIFFACLFYTIRQMFYASLVHLAAYHDFLALHFLQTFSTCVQCLFPCFSISPFKVFLSLKAQLVYASSESHYFWTFRVVSALADYFYAFLSDLAHLKETLAVPFDLGQYLTIQNHFRALQHTRFILVQHEISELCHGPPSLFVALRELLLQDGYFEQYRHSLVVTAEMLVHCKTSAYS